MQLELTQLNGTIDVAMTRTVYCEHDLENPKKFVHDHVLLSFSIFRKTYKASHKFFQLGVPKKNGNQNCFNVPILLESSRTLLFGNKVFIALRSCHCTLVKNNNCHDLISAPDVTLQYPITCVVFTH